MEGFDLVEDDKFSITTRRWDQLLNASFGIVGTEERFRECVVVAFAAAAHAAFGSTLREGFHAVFVDVLAAGADQLCSSVSARPGR